jgi:hypothetical protein
VALHRGEDDVELAGAYTVSEEEQQQQQQGISRANGGLEERRTMYVVVFSRSDLIINLMDVTTC